MHATESSPARIRKISGISLANIGAMMIPALSIWSFYFQSTPAWWALVAIVGAMCCFANSSLLLGKSIAARVAIVGMGLVVIILELLAAAAVVIYLGVGSAN